MCHINAVKMTNEAYVTQVFSDIQETVTQCNKQGKFQRKEKKPCCPLIIKSQSEKSIPGCSLEKLMDNDNDWGRNININQFATKKI